MKKNIRILSLVLISFLTFTAWSCSDDDDDFFEPIEYDRLPTHAKDFTMKYYDGIKIVSVERDRDDDEIEYEVVYANGDKVKFNQWGEWIEIDAPFGRTVPAGLVPEPIDRYVAHYHPGNGINEIKKTRKGYEVELLDGLELMFDYNGYFIKAEY